MLSYQHAFHAGNLADVHKHAILAEVLAYLVQKDKPISLIETHAGRGLYDLGDAAAQKTGEAAQGILALGDKIAPHSPYGRALAQTRAAHGAMAYPGSPLIGRAFLRPGDAHHLAELHPQEFAALRKSVKGAKVYRADGFELALSLCPPTPRRGVLLIDPSWEIREDYARLPGWLKQVNAKWNVGILMLWYPLLEGAPHLPMIRRITADFPDALLHEVRFPPARPGHRMVGSGMAVINPPWKLADSVRALETVF